MIRILDLFRKLDVYGHKVKLLYSGQETMKTIPGSILTILTYLFLIWYLAVLLIDVDSNEYTIK